MIYPVYFRFQFFTYLTNDSQGTLLNEINKPQRFSMMDSGFSRLGSFLTERWRYFLVIFPKLEKHALVDLLDARDAPLPPPPPPPAGPKFLHCHAIFGKIYQIVSWHPRLKGWRPLGNTGTATHMDI